MAWKSGGNTRLFHQQAALFAATVHRRKAREVGRETILEPIRPAFLSKSRGVSRLNTHPTPLVTHSRHPPSTNRATRAQQLQFAFGSKIIKPSTSKAAGMSAAAGGAGAGMPTRGRAGGVGAVAADAGPTRSRR